jgi:hypothetical protein
MRLSGLGLGFCGTGIVWRVLRFGESGLTLQRLVRRQLVYITRPFHYRRKDVGKKGRRVAGTTYHLKILSQSNHPFGGTRFV